ncbi:MAG TPA: Rieske (2Fe-2S) protein [Solirubrobacteraceae bacterium]|jgi:3-phenylpropionate/trans-cinnamate dioxygenase ferredoxin subunit
MTRHVLFPATELPEGTKRIVDVGGRSIGVMHLGDRYYALRNACPHHGAPLCEGTISGTMSAGRPYEYTFDAEDLVLRCPWHGYEFRLDTGESIIDPRGTRVRTYRVVDEDGELVLYA